MEIKLGKLLFRSPIINASGVWCTTEKELRDIGESQSGAIVFKTMTLQPRQGNPEPRLYLSDSFSINSMGLPNLGVDYYCSIVNNLKKFKKPLIASIAGFKEEEFYKLIDKVDKRPFDAIEINLSCPNLAGKSIFAYDKNISTKILIKARKMTKKPIGVKLPPYSQRYQIDEISKVFIKTGVDYLVLINSYPLSTEIDINSERLVIKPNLGIGGLGGAHIRQISLAQVLLFNSFLKGRIPIIGVGGVEKADDIYKFILAGASLVGIATGIYKKGPRIFSELLSDFKKLMIKKKIDSFIEKVGKVKFIK